MANNCITEIKIVFNNQFDKETMLDKLNVIIHDARLRDEGIFLGSATKYFFDGEVSDISVNEIFVVGWVKWNLSDENIIEYIKYFNDIAFIEKIEIKCFECGSEICEKYEYDCSKGNTIYHKWLNFNYDEDIEIDDYFDELNNNPSGEHTISIEINNEDK